jgi:hypothetical protein
MNKKIEVSLVQRGMHLLDNYGGFVGLAVVLVAVFILAFSK